MQKKRLLFFGELPPRSIHGVPISNQVNLSMLAENYIIDIVEEHIDLIEYNRFSLNKYFAFLRYCRQVLLLAIRHKYHYYYATFSLSFVGCFKSSVPILLFKIFNPKARVVVHIHRGDFHLFYKRKLLHRLASRIIFGLAEHIVFLSDKFIYKQLPYSHKYVVLPNTIFPILPENTIPVNKRFLFLSNYIFEKGILEFLEAIHQLSDQGASARCFGQFTSEEIKSKVRRMLSPSVELNELIEDEHRKYKEIASAMCLVLPSHNEGQPLVLLEAMAAGTLVIASNVGAIPDMLGQEYPFTTQAKSVESLRETMLKVLALQPEERTYWSDYLQKRFQHYFSQESHKASLYAIFKP